MTRNDVNTTGRVDTGERSRQIPDVIRMTQPSRTQDMSSQQALEFQTSQERNSDMHVNNCMKTLRKCLPCFAACVDQCCNTGEEQSKNSPEEIELSPLSQQTAETAGPSQPRRQRTPAVTFGRRDTSLDGQKSLPRPQTFSTRSGSSSKAQSGPELGLGYIPKI